MGEVREKVLNDSRQGARGEGGRWLPDERFVAWEVGGDVGYFNCVGVRLDEKTL
jgi:hypothetical protein